PQALGLGEEGVRRLAAEHVPGTLVDLDLQLADAPPRVSGEDPQRRDLGGQQLGRCAQVDQANPRHQRGSLERAPAERLTRAAHEGKRECAVRRYRAAPEHHRRSGHQLLPRLEHLADRNMCGPVQHHAESSLLILVLDDQDDGPAEVWITEQRRSREQLPAERCILHVPMMRQNGSAALNVAGANARRFPRVLAARWSFVRFTPVTSSLQNHLADRYTLQVCLGEWQRLPWRRLRRAATTAMRQGARQSMRPGCGSPSRGCPGGCASTSWPG